MTLEGGAVLHESHIDPGALACRLRIEAASRLSSSGASASGVTGPAPRVAPAAPGYLMDGPLPEGPGSALTYYQLWRRCAVTRM